VVPLHRISAPGFHISAVGSLKPNLVFRSRCKDVFQPSSFSSNDGHSQPSITHLSILFLQASPTLPLSRLIPTHTNTIYTTLISQQQPRCLRRNGISRSRRAGSFSPSPAIKEKDAIYQTTHTKAPWEWYPPPPGKHLTAGSEEVGLGQQRPREGTDPTQPGTTWTAYQ
jgi:hypothetical protein